MIPIRSLQDIVKTRSTTLKISPRKMVMSNASLLRKDPQKKIEDIIINGKSTLTYIGKRKNLRPLQKQFTTKEKSLDPITTTPCYPINIADKEAIKENHWTTIFHLREALVVGLITIFVLQGTFLLHAGIKFKDTLFQHTFAGIEELKSAKTDLSQANFAATLQHFLAAQTAFANAHSDIEVINGGISILPNSLLNTSSTLLDLGESIASVGTNLTNTVNILLATTNFRLALPEIKKAQLTLREASRTLTNFSSNDLPPEYQARIDEIKHDLPLLNQSLDFFDTITPALMKLTAYNDTKRYLIMLQNTAERRGTGGFMGSFIEVTFQDGKLLAAEPKDIYTVDWQQFQRKPAPAFLQGYMKGLALRDANYNPDFYEASQDINWAYEHSRQGSIDGIMSIDQSIVPELLEATGPIYLPDFQITLTPENFFNVLQFYIETNKDDPVTPKKILLSFIKEFATKLNSIETILAIGQHIPQFIEEKHIQAAFFDNELEQIAEKYGIDGKLQTPTDSLDFLHINAINIGGNKGDNYLARDYHRQITIDHEGKITVTLTGTWKHLWNQAEEDNLNQMFPQLANLPRKVKENFWHVIGKSNTKHALRFFVPKGSNLTSSIGLNYQPTIGEENGYTVLYSELDIPLSEQRTFSLHYTLPYQLNVQTGDTYRFLMQKQAGATNETLQYTVNLAAELEPLANYPSNISQGPNSQTISTDLNTDRYFEMLVRRKL